MKNPKQQLLLEIAEQNKEIIYKDNKVLAKLNWIIPWNKNPKFIKEENLEKLKKQIVELDVYKPLLIALNDTNAIILGGNQRHKALKELAKENPEKYEYVWISLVEAESDAERLKYCLSDNTNLGEYNREELYELIKPLADQPSLFADYDIEINEPQDIKQFVDDFVIGVDELRIKQLKKQLKEAGINDETIDIVVQMSSFNRDDNRIEDVNIKGACMKAERYPLAFWVEDKEVWEKLFNVFSVGGTQRLNTQLLVDKFL